MSVRMPRLLDNQLQEVERMHPTALSLTLTSPGVSQATMALLPRDTQPAMHQWMEIFTPRGSAGFFRVIHTVRTYTGETELNLRHGIDTMADSVLEMQEDFSGTVAQLLALIIGAQKTRIKGVAPWQLGDVEDETTLKRSLNYDRLSDLLSGIEEEKYQYAFEYDFSTWPWTLHFRQKPAEVASEFRLARNIESLQITWNDADLCTQLLLSVNVQKTVTPAADQENNWPGLTTTDSVVRTYNNAEAQALWGIVQKTASIDTDDDIAGQGFPDADAWAARYMRDHAEPTLQIQIDGEDLSEYTFDIYDEASLGKLCRVSLPDYTAFFTERVVSIQYQDLLGSPERITVSLANRLPRVTGAIAQAQKAAGAAGASAATARRASGSVGGGGGTAKELESWSMIVKRVKEADDATGITELAETGIVLDPDSGATLYSLKQGFVSQYAALNVNSEQISTIVRKSGINELGENETLTSRITQTAEEIRASVYQASSQIYSSLQMTASNIRSEIADTEQGLITYVNQTASGIFTRMESGTNRTKIQETDPTLDEGYTPKEGDFWVESVHDGTWDGADGYDWDREEPYDWSQLMGARVKVWKNGKWQVVTDRQQMVSYRDVVDTAQVYLDRRISEIVNDEGLLDVYMAKLERTATDLRSEISHATSDFYSEIHQSSSNVTVWVANRPTSIIQDGIKSGKPTTMTIGNLTRAPIAGDLWIDSANQDTWDKALNGDHKWDDDAPYSWNELRSDKLYKYDGTDWAEIMDGSQLLYEDTYTEQDERHRAEIARKIEKVDGEWRDNYSRIEQRADMIYSTVQDRTANLSSRIEQTADRVSSAVGDITRIDGKISEVEGSAIWQRRDSITQVVGKFSVDSNGNIVLQSGASFKITKDGVQSDVVAQTQVDVINGTLTTHNTRITQNANEIATKASSTTVNAIDKTVSNHTTQIKQNADAIALRAKQTDLNAATGRISTVESTLSVQADQISSKVSKDGVISSINQTSESVTINAAKINLSGYVTASQLQATNTEITNLKSGKTTATVIATSVLNCTTGQGQGTFTGIKTSGMEFANNQMQIRSLTMGSFISHSIMAVKGTGGLSLDHYHAISASAGSDGKITITQGAAQDTPGTATFNMADTSWYKGQVSAIKNAVTLSSPGWVDGKNVVSNSANSKTYTVNLPAFQTGGGTVWSNHKTTVTFSTQSVQTPLKSVEVDATSEYDNGYSAGYAAGGGGASYTPVTYARGGLNTLYGYRTLYAVGDDHQYHSVGAHYWYWANNSVDLTTLYEKN